VSKVDEVDTWIDEVVRDHGRLDGAANVAGVAGGQGQLTEDVVSIDDILGTFNSPL
jgi:NAD(P)-dependent dehydrogenase (short-subunit alcohol dehydrogenase family)